MCLWPLLPFIFGGILFFTFFFSFDLLCVLVSCFHCFWCVCCVLLQSGYYVAVVLGLEVMPPSGGGRRKVIVISQGIPGQWGLWFYVLVLFAVFFAACCSAGFYFLMSISCDSGRGRGRPTTRVKGVASVFGGMQPFMYGFVI